MLTVFFSKKVLATVLISAVVGGVGVWSGTVAFSTAAPPSPPLSGPSSASKSGVEALAGGPSAIVQGNPQGDVTVVEFFDYQCPVCRKVHPVVVELVAEDRNVRLIHKHWPVFGSASIYASKVALAARWQDRYEQIHDALMRISGHIDEDKIRQAATAARVDMARIERDLETRAAEIEAAFAEASVQARSLQLPGTPGFVIGNYLVPGGLDLATMKEVVAEVRSKRAGDKPG